MIAGWECLGALACTLCDLFILLLAYHLFPPTPSKHRHFVDIVWIAVYGIIYVGQY